MFRSSIGRNRGLLGRLRPQRAGSPVNLRAALKTVNPGPRAAGCRDEMGHSSRRRPIAAVRLEAIGITDRTDLILNPNSMAFNPIFGQNAAREQRQIELKMVAATRFERLLEILRIILRESHTDGIVHFVTAGAPGRSDRRDQVGPLGRRHRCPYARLDDAFCQPAPARMNRRHHTPIVRGNQNWNTVRSHDPDAKARRRADDHVRARRISGFSRRRLEYVDSMNLTRKYCVFRRLRVPQAETMLDSDVYENAVA